MVFMSDRMIRQRLEEVAPIGHMEGIYIINSLDDRMIASTSTFGNATGPCTPGTEYCSTRGYGPLRSWEHPNAVVRETARDIDQTNSAKQVRWWVHVHQVQPSPHAPAHTLRAPHSACTTRAKATPPSILPNPQPHPSA